MLSQDFIRETSIVLTGVLVSALLFEYTPEDTSCPVDIRLYLLVTCVVIGSDTVAHLLITEYHRMTIPTSKDNLELTSRESKQPQTMALLQHVPKSVQLFCMSAAGVNLIWLMVATSKRCSLGVGMSYVYWMLAGAATLAAIITGFQLVRQAVKGLKVVFTLWQTLLTSSKLGHPDLRVGQSLSQSSQPVYEKMGELWDDSPRKPAVAPTLHLELFRESFTWRLSQQEEKLLSQRLVRCPVCEQSLLTGEQTVLFPFFFEQLDELNKQKEIDKAVIKTLKGIERQGILEVVCPQQSGELLKYFKDNQINWKNSHKNIAEPENGSIAQLIEHRFLHATCHRTTQESAPGGKLCGAFVWARKRLEELNLNHAVKRDIPRFYGILLASP